MSSEPTGKFSTVEVPESDRDVIRNKAHDLCKVIFTAVAERAEGKGGINEMVEKSFTVAINTLIDMYSLGAVRQIAGDAAVVSLNEGESAKVDAMFDKVKKARISNAE